MNGDENGDRCEFRDSIFIPHLQNIDIGKSIMLNKGACDVTNWRERRTVFVYNPSEDQWNEYAVKDDSEASKWK